MLRQAPKSTGAPKSPTPDISKRRMAPLPSGVVEHFVRSSGPGGQNVNKVSTAVELRFPLAESDLTEAVKARLRALAGARVTSEDVLIVEAREHRTQLQNREAARERLMALIARASRVPKKRRATRPPFAERERRLQSKTKRAVLKRRRSKPGDEE